ncbi:hypothetical protein [Natrialba sp. INN-245]|uniref:hypothetical protein n=1 Tax=Natrialba sp. INN-245 TaxID=2690967 RepID=UPI001313BACE|nr:hypothetical protein [Natrialba sp. INN-245]MWV41281.1 hypothetical protein [Natrialba sp. INN-245]
MVLGLDIGRGAIRVADGGAIDTVRPIAYPADSVTFEDASVSKSAVRTVERIESDVDELADSLESAPEKSTVATLEADVRSVEDEARSLDARLSSVDSDVSAVEARLSDLENGSASTRNWVTFARNSRRRGRGSTRCDRDSRKNGREPARPRRGRSPGAAVLESPEGSHSRSETTPRSV